VTSDPHAIEHPGDPRHPDHARFLAELGRAAYAAARVAGIAFDIVRVFDGSSSAEMYDDPLGRLVGRLAALKGRMPDLPGLTAFVATIRAALVTRNDLAHALPVKDGLHRRRTKDLHYVRNFFSVEDVAAATQELEHAWQEGSRVLYHDGGASVNAWYAVGGT
jgi:hypothetical protein